jgi:hypothetical protein
MLERERFDVLHFHEPFVPFLSLFLLRESTSVNVATFHAYAGFSPSYEFGSRFLGGYAERLHGRIAVSAAARHFIDRYFPGDYKLIPNGVDISRFDRAVPIARWQDGTRNLLFVGRHEPRKGLLDLLKAYRLLRKTGCDCRLLVVGSGPQEREARRYVAIRRLSGVEFLGRVSDRAKAQLFKNADVYVSPATGGESFGIVLLEAMAAGAPIVCSDIHGYKGVVRRGREALLVPPRSPKALAGAIATLLMTTPPGRDGRGRPCPRRGVQLAAGHRPRGVVLQLRHPPAGRHRPAPGGVQRSDPASRRNAAAAGPGHPDRGRPPRRHGGRRRRQRDRRRSRHLCREPRPRDPALARAPRRGLRLAVRRAFVVQPALDGRDPPRPRGVADHEAGHEQAEDEQAHHRRREVGRRAAVDGADRELEVVQVGRQAGPGSC